MICKQELPYILMAFKKSNCIYSSSTLALECFSSNFSFKDVISFFYKLILLNISMKDISLGI